MLVLLVTFKIKPEFRQLFIEASLEDASSSIKYEKECIRFDVFEDIDDKNQIYFYEIYINDDAFANHLKSPHFLKWRDSVKDDWFLEPYTIKQANLISSQESH